MDTVKNMQTINVDYSRELLKGKTVIVIAFMIGLAVIGFLMYVSGSLMLQGSRLSILGGVFLLLYLYFAVFSQFHFATFFEVFGDVIVSASFSSEGLVVRFSKSGLRNISYSSISGITKFIIDDGKKRRGFTVTVNDLHKLDVDDDESWSKFKTITAWIPDEQVRVEEV